MNVEQIDFLKFRAPVLSSFQVEERLYWLSGTPGVAVFFLNFPNLRKCLKSKFSETFFFPSTSSFREVFPAPAADSSVFLIIFSRFRAVLRVFPFKKRRSAASVIANTPAPDYLWIHSEVHSPNRVESSKPHISTENCKRGREINMVLAFAQLRNRDSAFLSRHKPASMRGFRPRRNFNVRFWERERERAPAYLFLRGNDWFSARYVGPRDRYVCVMQRMEYPSKFRRNEIKLLTICLIDRRKADTCFENIAEKS